VACARAAGFLFLSLSLCIVSAAVVALNQLFPLGLCLLLSTLRCSLSLIFLRQHNVTASHLCCCYLCPCSLSALFCVSAFCPSLFNVSFHPVGSAQSRETRANKGSSSSPLHTNTNPPIATRSNSISASRNCSAHAAHQIGFSSVVFCSLLCVGPRGHERLSILSRLLTYCAIVIIAR